MESNKKYGAAECADCNTCERNCNGVSDEEKALEAQEALDAAVQTAASIERNSFEKNLTRTLTKTPVKEQSHEGLTLYTLIIYSENYAGILNQITAVFTRRQVNIESLNVCASSTPGVHKYTITCYCKQEMAEMLCKQIERKIDVLQANCFVDDEIFILETSLLKLSTPMVLSDKEISRIVRRYGARIVEVNPTFTTVEKTGITDDILNFFRELNSIGCVLQFVRSGRIAITKSCIERLDAYLTRREEDQRLYD